MTDPASNRIRAPFTPEQIHALNTYQEASWFHPFTCPREHGQETKLVAHADGWHCPRPGCDYRQDWAHTWMAATAATEIGQRITDEILADPAEVGKLRTARQEARQGIRFPRPSA